MISETSDTPNSSLQVVLDRLSRIINTARQELELRGMRNTRWSVSTASMLSVIWIATAQLAFFGMKILMARCKLKKPPIYRSRKKECVHVRGKCWELVTQHVAMGSVAKKKKRGKEKKEKKLGKLWIPELSVTALDDAEKHWLTINHTRALMHGVTTSETTKRTDFTMLVRMDSNASKVTMQLNRSWHDCRSLQ